MRGESPFGIIMTLENELNKVFEIREKIKEVGSYIGELESKLQKRKEELLLDPEFNDLNDEYVKAQEEELDLIKEFTSATDLLVDKGKPNEK